MQITCATHWFTCCPKKIPKLQIFTYVFSPLQIKYMQRSFEEMLSVLMKYKLLQQHSFALLEKKKKSKSLYSQPPCELLVKGLLLSWSCCNFQSLPSWLLQNLGNYLFQTYGGLELKIKQIEMSLESFVEANMAASGTIKGKNTDYRKKEQA